MPATIRVMSWNIQKKVTNAPYIAELMYQYDVDILTLLEVPHGNATAILTDIIFEIDNLPNAYHTGDWFWQWVLVGDETVGFIWHQTNVAAANAFRVDTMVAGGARVTGAVTRNAANAPIYFPATQTNWGQIAANATPNGRRPGYISFVTNDLALAQRRFTVLNLHTPFPKSGIQAYAASLLATSREIHSVDRVDKRAIAAGVAGGLSAAMAGTIDPIIGNVPTSLALRNAAVIGAGNGIDQDEIDLEVVLSEAATAGARAALNTINITLGLTTVEGQAVARACAMAGVGAAATMVASMQLPTGPGPATGSAANARTYAMAQAQALVVPGQLVLPKKRSPGTYTTAVKLEMERIVDSAIQHMTFNALPLTPVDTAIVAGDFNVNYPDLTVYKPSQQASMGGGGYNAYTRLLALGPLHPVNQEKSTRIGPTAFRGQLVYTLTNPCPIQSVNNALVTYTPLNMTALVNVVTSYPNWAAWGQGLNAMAKAQGVPWKPLINNATYSTRINNAFDKIVNNDTRYYRANCYDNIFVRNGGVNSCTTIDVMSELGSWLAGPAIVNPVPAMAPNPWAAALGNLNGIAQVDLGLLPPPITYTYKGIPYTITPMLADACEAAVFYNEYISDHLPVMAEVVI